MGESGTRCSEHVVMGLEAKRRTVHDPRYYKTPKNEKRLNFSSKPFILGESGTRCAGHAVMGLEAKRRTVHDPRYYKTPKNEKRLTFSSKPFIMGERWGSNPRPSVPQTDALTD